MQKLKPVALLIAVVAAISSQLIYSAHAQNQGTLPVDPTDDTVLWTSTSSNAADFARELSDLYTTLINTGRLSLRANVVATADSIEKVLRDNGVLLGPIYPPELDSLVCDLNADRCERVRQTVTQQRDRVSQTDRALSGYPVSSTTWDLKAGDRLVLPAIKLTKIPKWVQQSLSPNESLSKTVVEQLGGCIALDDDCKAQILKFNRKLGDDFFQNSASPPTASLSLPVIAARAKVDIASADEGQGVDTTVVTGKADQSLQLSPYRDGSFKLKNVSQPTLGNAFQDISNLPPLADFTNGKTTVLKALRSNSLGGARDSTRFGYSASLLTSDFTSRQDDMGKLISFPYSSPDQYPSLVRGATIGLFDSWVDAGHCAFKGAGFTVHNLSDQPGDRGTCNQEVDSGEIDHGTHIAGLIAGRLSASQRIGLNPFARLVSYEVDFSKLSDPAELSSLASKIDALPQEGIDVVNLSFGYMLDPQRGFQDPVQTSILSQQDRTLFVVAAGNYGADTSYICDLRPTCFDLPNVLVVGALDRNDRTPQLLRASNGKLQTNFGQRVHVGAIGENVFSTIAFDRYGTMSGTSFAAPQVAAVASLAMRMYRRLSPQQIKNRIIYCSDYVSSLGDNLFGGRLNAGCVLDGMDSSLTLTTSPAGTKSKGFFQAGTILKLADRKSGRIVQMPVEGIRALHFDPSRQCFTVYFNADGDSDSRLIREVNLVPVTPTDAVSFVESGSPKSILVANIVRYVSGAK